MNPKYTVLLHSAAICTIVLACLYYSVDLLTLFATDTIPYTFSFEELRQIENSPNDVPKPIPPIIHQVYLGWDNKTMPEAWQKNADGCKEVNSNFEYMFWTNESSRELLKTHYPWFLETYDNYRYPIQQADSIRYFILNQHGGIYIDLDNGCVRKLDPLLASPAWMPGTTNLVGLTNHIMGTKPKHPYFELLVNSIQEYDKDYILPYLTIMNSAGPHYVSYIWQRYLRRKPERAEEVRIFTQEQYLGNDESFFTKEDGGTWCHWDTGFFAWAGQHLIFVGFVVVAILSTVVTIIWLVGFAALRKLANNRRLGYIRMIPWEKSD